MGPPEDKANDQRLGFHACLPFHGRTELVSAAQDYVAAGLTRGEQVVCASHDTAALREELAGVDRIAPAIERGLMLFVDLELPGPEIAAAAPPEPSPLAELTAQARAGNAPRLRVLSDATGLVGDPPGRARYVRYEHLVDRFCLDHAVTCLCAYDVDALGDSAVQELVCVHARSYGEHAPFRLVASPTTDVALAGWVDVFSAQRLVETLRRIVPVKGRTELVVDANELEFVDHHAMLALERYAVERGGTVVVVGASPLVSRLTALLGLRAVRVA